MSKYNSYAKRVDEHAKENFAAFLKAQSELEAAEKYYNANKRPNGIWVVHDNETIARTADAEAKYYAKKSAYEAARRAFASSVDKIPEIRAELQRLIEADLSANPDHLDNNTMELLKSGILKPEEYARLLDRFSDNPTMVRMIGHYAEAQTRNEQLPVKDRTAYSAAAHAARNANGGDKLEAMDYLADVYGRCVRNPAMISHWDELTGKVMEAF